MKSTVENIHFYNAEGVECGKIVEIQLRWSCCQRFLFSVDFIYGYPNLRLSALLNSNLKHIICLYPQINKSSLIFSFPFGEGRDGARKI
jgi:hypothetical protein